MHTKYRGTRVTLQELSLVLAAQYQLSWSQSMIYMWLGPQRVAALATLADRN